MAEPFDEFFQALRVKGVMYYAQEFRSLWALRFAATAHARVHAVWGESATQRRMIVTWFSARGSWSSSLLGW